MALPWRKGAGSERSMLWLVGWNAVSKGWGGKARQGHKDSSSLLTDMDILFCTSPSLLFECRSPDILLAVVGFQSHCLRMPLSHKKQNPHLLQEQF